MCNDTWLLWAQFLSDSLYIIPFETDGNSIDRETGGSKLFLLLQFYYCNRNRSGRK